MCLPITPTFVLPYKRYASFSLLPLAKQYLDNDRQSYQKSVAPQGRAIGYVTPESAQKIDERALHRTTIWRLIGYLGALVIALRYGLESWEEHDPQSTFHRFAGDVAPHKYRSPQRGETLRTARRLLHLTDRWDRTFPEKFFPRFATRLGFD